MSFRFSIGSRWFSVWLFTKLMAGGYLYIQVECGHNSQRNLLHVYKHHTGVRFYKIGRRKTKILMPLEDAV